MYSLKYGCSNNTTDSIKVCDTESFVQSLVARKWLLDDVFINIICNEIFGTPSGGITLITLLNTTLPRSGGILMMF